MQNKFRPLQPPFLGVPLRCNICMVSSSQGNPNVSFIQHTFALMNAGGLHPRATTVTFQTPALRHAAGSDQSNVGTQAGGTAEN